MTQRQAVSSLFPRHVTGKADKLHVRRELTLVDELIQCVCINTERENVSLVILIIEISLSYINVLVSFYESMKNYFTSISFLI